MKGKINIEEGMITELPTIKEPEKMNYLVSGHKDKCQCARCIRYRDKLKIFNEHLAALRSFPIAGEWKAKTGDEVEFTTSIQYFYANEWHGGMSGSNGDIKRWDEAGQKTREVAKPIAIPDSQPDEKTWKGIYTGDEFPDFYGKEIEIGDDHSNPNNPCYKIRFIGESQWHDNMGEEDWKADNQQSEEARISKSGWDAADEYTEKNQSMYEMLIQEADFKTEIIEQWSHADFYQGFLAGYKHAQPPHTGEQEAIAFAEWTCKGLWTTHNGLWYEYRNEDNPISGEQLYQQYLKASGISAGEEK